MSKNKTAGKFAAKKKKSHKGLVIALVIAALLLVAVIGMLMMLPEDNAPTQRETGSQTVSEETKNAETGATEEIVEEQITTPIAEGAVNLGYGIYMTDIAPYTGMYMEDGTDEVLSNVLMLVLQNNGQQDIQLADISLKINEQKADFTVTTLPVGAQIVVLEKSRMQWDENVDYDTLYPMVDKVAYFQEPISTQEDKLKIGIMDGAINVTNISGADIPGTIAVYYKNAAQDIYYGGITYRITIEGGLKADEIRQVMTNHASDTGSEIMFVTISQ